jgi:hypothetical protein
MLAAPGIAAGAGAAACAISRPGCASVTKPRRHAVNTPAILILEIFIALSQPSLIVLISQSLNSANQSLPKPSISLQGETADLTLFHAASRSRGSIGDHILCSPP